MVELTRRKALILGAMGAGSSIAGVKGLMEDGKSGKISGGTMALSQAYNVAGDLWIGPDSTRSNVDAESGRVFMASDTQVDYHGDSGSWIKMGVGSQSEPVPSVTTERLSNEQGQPDKRWVVRESLDASTDFGGTYDCSQVDEIKLRLVNARADSNNAQYKVYLQYTSGTRYDNAEYNYRRENASTVNDATNWQLIDDASGGWAVSMTMHFWVGPDAPASMVAQMGYEQGNAKSIREGWMNQTAPIENVEEIELTATNPPQSGTLEVVVPQ